MIASIRETLAFGLGVPSVEWKDVGWFIRQNYIGKSPNGPAAAEQRRRARAKKRHQLYRGAGDEHMNQLLGEVFSDKDVLEKRTQWVPYTKHDNVLRKVVGELATVYTAPATRTVDGDENNRRYQEVQRLCRQSQVMQRANQMAVLHNAIAIGPRIRIEPDGVARPVLDVITPANFYAVRDPADATLCIGLIFENDYCLASPSATFAKYTLWGWREQIPINSDGEVIVEDIKEHDRGRIPWDLFTLEPPDGCLLDEDTGEDLVAAQMLTWFLHLLHAKEAKSATKQLAIQGDLSRAIRNQAQDTEVDFELPADANAQVHDRGMDFEAFSRSAQHARETAAGNRGVPPTVMRGEGAESADAREVSRYSLRELRLQQQIPFRDMERSLADHQSRLMTSSRPDLVFTLDNWRMDFSDPQTPLGTMEALNVKQKRLELGLTSVPTIFQEENPDLTREAALGLEAFFLSDKTRRALLLRDFMVFTGGLATSEVGDEAAGISAANTGTENRDPSQEAA